jgi:hypothetical protein
VPLSVIWFVVCFTCSASHTCTLSAWRGAGEPMGVLGIDDGAELQRCCRACGSCAGRFTLQGISWRRMQVQEICKTFFGSWWYYMLVEYWSPLYRYQVFEIKQISWNHLYFPDTILCYWHHCSVICNTFYLSACCNFKKKIIYNTVQYSEYCITVSINKHV